MTLSTRSARSSAREERADVKSAWAERSSGEGVLEEEGRERIRRYDVKRGLVVERAERTSLVEC